MFCAIARHHTGGRSTRPTSVAGWRRAGACMAAAAALCIAQAASAAEETRFQVTPFFSYATGDDFEDAAGAKREADDTGGFGIAFDIVDHGSAYYELLFSSFGTEVDGDVEALDLDIQYLQIGGTLAWPDAVHVIPYIAMTVGAARFDPDLDDLDSATKFAFTIGAGVRVPITSTIGVRAEWRTYGTVLGNDSDLFCVSASGAATCNLHVKGNTFLQHSAQLGVIIGFGK